MTTHNISTGRKKTRTETRVLELPIYNLREYANLVDIPYSTFSKMTTGHTLVAVKLKNRRTQYIHPDIASEIAKKFPLEELKKEPRKVSK